MKLKNCKQKIYFSIIKGIDDNNKLQKMWSSDCWIIGIIGKKIYITMFVFLVFMCGMFWMFSEWIHNYWSQQYECFEMQIQQMRTLINLYPEYFRYLVTDTTTNEDWFSVLHQQNHRVDFYFVCAHYGIA